ncbi:MAG: DNA alkylation response protein, partial [Oceanococcaceae bacterium]
MQDLGSPQAGETHPVGNIGSELEDYNLFTTDTALVEAVRREGGDWGLDALSRFGEDIGRAEYLDLGHLANRYPPELDTHDRFGRRIDRVRYHPAYHQLMAKALELGIHSDPWTDPRPGAHVVRGAKGFLHS